MSVLFYNYEAFYNMLLGCAVMTNTYSRDAVLDCKRIIGFIGEAYGVGHDFLTAAEKVILDDLAPMSTVQDLVAFDSSKSFDGDYTDLDRFIEVKNDVVSTLEKIRKNTYLENPGWVDYSHLCVYQADMRFKKLMNHSITGDLISTRQVGILLALGIGCRRDFAAASRKLLQCALWGDVAAARLYSYVERLTKSEKAGYATEYAELVSIYLDDGITVLPEAAKAKYSPEACLLYIYTSSIKYDVVYSLGNQKIDFSFLEVIMSDIPYAEKMTYIDEYDRKVWKKCTNKATEAQKTAKIGF